MRFSDRKDIRALGGPEGVFQRAMEGLLAPATGTFGHLADVIYHLWYGDQMFACLREMYEDAPFAAHAAEGNIFSLQLDDAHLGVTVARDSTLRGAASRSSTSFRNAWR